MDTSMMRTTDRLGRPTGPRRKYTVAEKQAILAETRRRGASVAEVARAHGINANLLFGWRRLERRGALCAESADPLRRSLAERAQAEA
jgi:transposase